MMQGQLEQTADEAGRLLEAGVPVILAELAQVSGSAPREEGAVMLVTEDDLSGTIGGGRLEWMAIGEARRLLETGEHGSTLEVALGPETGQCCGGRVSLSLRLVDRAIAQELAERAAAGSLPEIFVFGAGHTGAALVRALSPLPLKVTVADMRADLAEPLSELAETAVTPMPESLVRSAGPGAAFVVMTHDHQLDFLLAAEALARGDAAYAGMIGSKTKRAVFKRWLKENGYDPAIEAGLVCPIGGTEIRDKRPEVIAALTAAELLAVFAGRQAV